MALTIYSHEPTQSKSGLQRFSEKIGESLQQENQRQTQLKELQAENQSIKQNYGIDLSGISDPKAREKILVEKLKGEKGLTPLQESQKALADARIKDIDENRNMFNRLLPDQKNQQYKESVGDEGPQPVNAPQGQNQFSGMSKQQLQQAAAFKGQPGQAGIIGNMAQAELDRQEKESEKSQKSFESERSYHTQFSKPLEESVNTLRNTLPKQEHALNFARQAIESGEVGAFSMNHIADVMGLDSLRDKTGAQLVLASKEQLLPTLGRLSSKAQNLYMEKRMASMIPQIGLKDEANLTMQEMLEGEAFLDRAYLTEFDRLSGEDQNQYGFVKKDIDKRVHASMKPLETEISKRTNYRLREIEENSMGLKSMNEKVGKDVKIPGTPLTLAMAKLYKNKFGDKALEVAKKNGYYIPTLEEFKIFQYRPEEFREQELE